jgi:hypothetical protein
MLFEVYFKLEISNLSFWFDNSKFSFCKDRTSYCRLFRSSWVLLVLLVLLAQIGPIGRTCGGGGVARVAPDLAVGMHGV